MDQIRAFGRVPRLTEMDQAKRKRKHTNEDEYVLAERLRDAKRKCLLSESQVAELEGMPKYHPKQECAQRMTTLVAEIPPFGRVSQLTVGMVAQVALADRLRWAKRRGQLSHSHGAGQPVLKVPRTGSERLTPESGLSLAPTAASQPASSQR